MPNYVNSKFKGVEKFGNSLLNENLESSLCSFFDWGMLEIGAFYNYSYPSNAPYGGDDTVLKPVKDPIYQDGRVWESKRGNWVWETGLQYCDYQPISVSGVYVNNNFIPATSTGSYAHKINYIDGRVIFNSSIPTGSVVRCNHSEKYSSWKTSNSPWFQELIPDTFRPDITEPSGKMAILAKNRVSSPAIVVEVCPGRKFIPFQIGGGQEVLQDVKFHIYSENTWDKKKLIDIITYQKDRNINLYDLTTMSNSGLFPLDYNGSVTGNITTYPDWSQDAFWKKAYIHDAKWESEINYPPFLFYNCVRLVPRIFMSEI